MQTRRIGLILPLALSLAAIGCGGDETAPESSTSTTSSYVPVGERPEEPKKEFPLPPDLDRIAAELEQQGLETHAKRPVGVLGNLEVEGGVVVTEWPDEHRRDRYVKVLELNQSKSNTEVLFDSVGNVVIWLDSDGEPTPTERAAYEAAVAAASR
jgi:hypothetical protein